MALSLAYIVSEWCQQSHLNTEDPAAAARGLRRTRTYRSWTYRPFRVPARAVLRLFFSFRRRGEMMEGSLYWMPDGPGRGGGGDGGGDANGYHHRYRSISLETFDENHGARYGHHQRHHDHRGPDPLAPSTSMASTPEFGRPPYFPGSRGILTRSRSRVESDGSTGGLLLGAAELLRPSDDEVVTVGTWDGAEEGGWGQETRSALESASQAGSAPEDRGGEGIIRDVMSPPHPSPPPPPPAARRSMELLGVGEGVASGLVGLRPAYARMGTDEPSGEAR
ncbi:uncharacterized protein BKCO1_90001 [Diplodia corticola]|uniref:Uncharacterized protein n=1 Tax=Diplodia corticola TaxID=236234 RepID=A0A1J9RWC0_9PEZI|nr:uncharacterized protein BKCO1_90001 [Diplodia corticola]OJD36915.1 hypothetical protein BKCO1_90001 [Diplodia corticola]